MSGKMTDEELKSAQVYAQFDHDPDDRVSSYRKWAIRLLAHIAAVTDELYEAHRWLNDVAEVVFLERPVGVMPVTTLDGVRALRERAKALETERTLIVNRWDEDAKCLTVIRQRARSEEALIHRGEVCSIMGGASEWDEAIHEEVMQRGDYNTVRDVALGVARYILGDDVAPVAHEDSQPVVAPSLSRPVSEMDGLEDGWCEPRAADQTPPRAPPEAFTMEKGLDAGVFEAPIDDEADALSLDDEAMIERASQRLCAPAEPTMAEAFAAMRRLMDWVSAQDADTHAFDGTPIGPPIAEARDALSLLERRMGVMKRAADALIAGAEEGRVIVADVNALASALSGAPEVYTLDEVASAIAGQGLDDAADAEILARLTAMRRTP